MPLKSEISTSPRAALNEASLPYVLWVGSLAAFHAQGFGFQDLHGQLRVLRVKGWCRAPGFGEKARVLQLSGHSLQGPRVICL